MGEKKALREEVRRLRAELRAVRLGGRNEEEEGELRREVERLRTEMREISAGPWVVYFLLRRLEKVANGLYVHANLDTRPEMLRLIRRIVYRCQWELIEQGTPLLPEPDNGGGGQGPECMEGYHEEFGICVPDDEEGV